MLDVNKIFNKLAIVEIPSDRGLLVSYNDETKIINLFEEDLSKVIAKSMYALAEYLGSKDIQINDLEKISTGIYKIR